MQRTRTEWIGRALLMAFVAVANSAYAQIDVSSDGSDGVFNPLSNVEIDLGLAPTATWSTAGSGNGVYDPYKWAVVFKYSSVNIPAGVTVTFKNNASRAPVVWLVQGSATINGTVSLNGFDSFLNPSNSSDYTWHEPGPGGFRGARRDPDSWGFGPGGGIKSSINSDTEISGTHDYGSAAAIPLIGGSGGHVGWGSVSGGGSGGGAILIAVSDTLSIAGAVEANGGAWQNYGGWHHSGAGGGGMIRLVADTMLGDGFVHATGPFHNGIIREESNMNGLTNPGNPSPSLATPSTPVKLWPDAADPRLQPISVDGQAISNDPGSSFFFPSMDASVAAAVPVSIRFQSTNVPPTATVDVRITPRAGDAILANATNIGTDLWELVIALPGGISAIQARASW